MNLEQLIQESIQYHLEVKFENIDINWYLLKVYTEWFYNIYLDDLKKTSNGKRLSTIFNCVNEILQSLNLFNKTEDLNDSTEQVILFLLYKFIN